MYVLTIRLADLALKEGIPPEEGWMDHVLKRYPNLDHYKCEEDARAVLNEKRAEIEAFFTKEREASIRGELAALIYALRLFGFEKIVDYCLELTKKTLLILGGIILEDFGNYIVHGIYALGGLRLFDDRDLRNMAFLGLKPAELQPSSASLSLATQRPLECSIVREPDRDDVRGFLKRGSDDELASYVGGFQRAAWDYDLSSVVKHYERLGEVISERYDEELKNWFRRSKVARGTVHGGIILTSSSITSFLPIPPGLNFLLNILLNIPQVLLQEHLERLSNWLVERWPFAEKGLPFLLWMCGIEPKGRAGGPPPRTSLDEWTARLAAS
jgi:hypothetical protein